MYQKMSIYRKKKLIKRTNAMQFSLYVKKRNSTKKRQKIKEPDISKNIHI